MLELPRGGKRWFTTARLPQLDSAGRVTLHLRAPNGTYAGPIVVGRRKKGKRAIVGVKAGARLGELT